MDSKFNEALTLLKKGQLSESKNLFFEILKNEPNNFAAYNNLANIFFFIRKS